MTLFSTVAAVPMPRRAGLLLQLWERLLKEAAEALLEELQMLEAEKPQGLAQLWESLHNCVGDVGADLCGILEGLRNAAGASSSGGAAPQGATGLAMELPEPRWLHALASASDTSCSFLERLPALRRLEPVLRARGHFGKYEDDVRVWLSLQEALCVREEELTADEAGVSFKWSSAS